MESYFVTAIGGLTSAIVVLFGIFLRQYLRMVEAQQEQWTTLHKFAESLEKIADVLDRLDCIRTPR
jgi:hypothetical protein